MDDKYTNIKAEIEKINHRVKEYLWKYKIYSKLEDLNTKMLEADFWHDKNDHKI